MAAKEYPSRIQEHGHEGEDGFDYYADDVSPSGCGCFCLKWWRGGGGGGGRAHPYMRRGSGGDEEESWVMSKLKKAREFTEVVAGPKWKNFIRKVGGYWRSDKKRNNNTSNFGYDAESYALNFDGGGDRGEEDGLLMKGFSARFVGSSRNDQERQAGIGLS